MKQNDYIVIQAPMITELGLSGNRLIVYALIHGFSKDGVHEFHGSINYICEWTNLTRNTVISVLKSLVDDGLITKREYVENKVKFCAYQIRGSAKNALLVQSTTSENENPTNLGSAKIAPNNNTIYCSILFSSYNIDSNNKDNNISSAKSKKDERVLKSYNIMGGLTRPSYCHKYVGEPIEGYDDLLLSADKIRHRNAVEHIFTLDFGDL